MEDDNKLVLARADIASAGEFLIAELDERLELSVLLLDSDFGLNIRCSTTNTNCADANCFAGCT